jgi:hypothetical protein
MHLLRDALQVAGLANSPARRRAFYLAQLRVRFGSRAGPTSGSRIRASLCRWRGRVPSGRQEAFELVGGGSCPVARAQTGADGSRGAPV